jgi:N-acetylneuraminic acid mutarotase
MFTKWNQRLVLLLAALLLMSGAAFATTQGSQENVWDRVESSTLQQRGIDNVQLPSSFETFRLNKAALETLLRAAPEEYTAEQAVILSLPMPDGSFQRFEVEHSLVVERGLLEKYPELGATYRGRGIDDPTAYVRFDFLPTGFHSMIISTAGTVIVDPYAKGDTNNYISYYKHDRPSPGPISCEVKGDDSFEPVTSARGFSVKDILPAFTSPEVSSGTQLRTYRLALAANNEYCVSVGGNTVAGSLAAMVLIMNRVNGVYEKDLAMHMNMVANNNLVVYAGDNLSCPVPGGTTACTAANDPYGNDTSALGQNTGNLNAVIGSGNYDIGHVFTTGSGGVAQLGVPCGGSKGAGTTGLPNPVGDDFAIDYVAHEMGHQWGANHTFNGTTDNCGGGNRSAGSAYETGSGITIMAYAGICGNQDLAQHSIDTFHVKSLEVITAFSQTGGGNACAVTTASGNTPPTVTGPGNFNIPKGTAFALTATASDINAGDSITYDWQEYDLGAGTGTVPNTDGDGVKPIFRPYLPSTSGTRFFPALQYIRNNANIPPSSYNCGRGVGAPCLTGELLPTVARTMAFQVVARDNHLGTGGINTATSQVTVDANSGPFNVTSPNTAVSYPGNSFQTITWNVANTSSAPVNAANVKISLSTDAGLTFPTVLADNIENAGTATLLIPNTPTTTARIKVEAVGNIFFDISNTNFSIVAGATGTPTPTATSTGSMTPTNTATATATAMATPCGVWVAGPPALPAGYAVGGALGSDGKFYIAGGQSADATPIISNQFQRFDPATNTWSSLAPMPVAISQGVVGAANGKIFVAGGFTGGTTVVNSLRIYDIATNTWTSGANMPGIVEAGGGAVVNGKFYVIGGDDFNVALATNFIYDIAANTWSSGAPMPAGRANTSATVANGQIYVYGGLIGSGFTATDVLLRYDPVANTWTTIGSAGTAARGNYGGISPFGTGQLLIISGGNTAFAADNTTRIFNIAAGTFSAGPNMISPRLGHAQATLPDGRVIVADGLVASGVVTSGVELIGPCGASTPTNTPTNTPTRTNTPTASATATATATGTSSPSCTPNVWQAGPAQAPARYAIQGVVGTDGKVYVAGGQSIDATPVLSNKLTRYNPATNAWEDLAPLPVAVGQATMGAANGKIYVAGGFTGGTTVTNALRIYDIATNTWTSGANMPAAKEAAAGAVVNGKFYVMGGDDFNLGVTSNYIYDIASNTWSSGAVLPDDRTNTYATALNGIVYVYGGVNIVGTAFVTTDTLLRYDPVANSWTNLGSAGTVGMRGNYGAVSPLGSGQLLIADGANAAGASTTATHIFTISTGTFSAGPAMTTARAGHAQATLPDGRVIVVDGFNGTTATTLVELLTGACATSTPTNTPTGTSTATPSSTSTPVITGTPTQTATATSTSTGTPSPTPINTFANNTPICTQLGTAGAPYPSTIQVAGGPNQIAGVRVTLFNITHVFPDNMDFLLVGPNGQKFILMADAGGAIPVPSPGVTLTFDDTALAVVPDSGPLTTGTFEPTSWEPGQASFPAPAPPAPYNEPGSTVGGTGVQTLNGNFRFSNSNGTWSLYMRDDGGLFETPNAITGCVNGGWQIQFVPTTAAGLGISGRVMTAAGQGIRNATVVVTGNSLAEPIVTQTGSFGFYSLDGLRAGETYVVTVNSRRYMFAAPSRVISLIDNVVDADFIADPQE